MGDEHENRDVFDQSDELLLRLFQGWIPEERPDIEPTLYAEVLNEAIRYHQQEIEDAEEWIQEEERFLTQLQLIVQHDLNRGCQPDPACAEFLGVSMAEYQACRRKIAEAENMIHDCESLLLELYEDHPELIDFDD